MGQHEKLRIFVKVNGKKSQNLILFLPLFYFILEALLPPSTVPTAVQAIVEISCSQSWKAKVCVLEFLQVTIFTNLAAFISVPEEAITLVETVLKLLKDSQLEVREKAGKVLGGLFHCNFVSASQRETYIHQFTKKLDKKLSKKMKEGADKAAWQARQTEALIQRHAGKLYTSLKFFVRMGATNDIPNDLIFSNSGVVCGSELMPI